MAQTLSQKLKLKQGDKVALLNPPETYLKTLNSADSSIKITSPEESAAQIHWFIKTIAELEAGLRTVVPKLGPDTILWAFFPKGSSKIQTDLTRDSGWQALQAFDNLQYLVLISFDETWSAFALRLKSVADIKKAAASQPREIYKYADSATKTITLPEDLARAFETNAEARSAFEALAFSHRREYVEWVVTAKRPETRQERIKSTLEKVLVGWKNPRNI